MYKLIPVLLILALPNGCTSEEEAGATETAYMPNDSLEHWVLRDPPHLLDLVMAYAPLQDSTPGFRPWNAIKGLSSPAHWNRKDLEKWADPNKDGHHLSGTVRCALRAGNKTTEKVYLHLSGHAEGMVELRLGSGYSREWEGIGMGHAFWAEVDSSRYEMTEECRTGLSGMESKKLYTLRLPGRQPLWVNDYASCGTMGCDHILIFRAMPFEHTAPCMN